MSQEPISLSGMNIQKILETSPESLNEDIRQFSELVRHWSNLASEEHLKEAESAIDFQISQLEKQRQILRTQHAAAPEKAAFYAKRLEWCQRAKQIRPHAEKLLALQTNLVKAASLTPPVKASVTVAVKVSVTTTQTGLPAPLPRPTLYQHR